MFIYRIIGKPHVGNSVSDQRSSPSGNTTLTRVVVFGDGLTVDSHGQCAIIHDRDAGQSKYLFIGEPRCHECGQCSRRPLSIDTIRVMERNTEVELKSRRLVVTGSGEEYCRAQGVILAANPPAGPTIGDGPAPLDLHGAKDLIVSL